MDYGNILSRAWRIIWENKFLILLGVIVALGSGSGGGASGGRSAGWSPGEGDFDFEMPRWDLPDLRGELGVPEAAVIAAILVLVSLAVVVGIALWIVSTIARGGLIAGVSAIDGGGASSFAQAWRAGWEKGWRLLGIGILPAIPGFILLIAGLGAAGLFAGIYGFSGERLWYVPGAGLGVLLAVLACVLIPISLILSLLRTFANRACMLEDVGVIEAYRRGLNVLVANIGPALILFLLQIVIGAVLGIAMLPFGFVMLLCCLLWPVLLAIRGAIATYFSTIWTLAWREWTGLGHAGEIAPETSTASSA
jgi:hypothetical protein